MTRTIPQDLILDCIQDVSTDLDINSDISPKDYDRKCNILCDIALKERAKDDEFEFPREKYSFIDYIDDLGLQIATIPVDSVLAWAMGDFFGTRLNPENETTIDEWAKHVRSMVVDKDNELVYFAHGIGYDWLDNDVLGGDGSGITRTAFWRGLTITTDYEKRD